MDAKAAQSKWHDEETTDFAGAKGAPGLGVPTEAETNTDKENRDKRKKSISIDCFICWLALRFALILQRMKSSLCSSTVCELE